MRIQARQCPFCKKLWKETDKEKYINHLKKEKVSIGIKNKIRQIKINNNKFIEIFEKPKLSKTLMEEILDANISSVFVSSYLLRDKPAPNVVYRKCSYLGYEIDTYFEYGTKIKLKDIVKNIIIHLREDKLYIELVFKSGVRTYAVHIHKLTTDGLERKEINIYTDGWCDTNKYISIYKDQYPEIYKRIELEFKLLSVYSKSLNIQKQ